MVRGQDWQQQLLLDLSSIDYLLHSSHLIPRLSMPSASRSPSPPTVTFAKKKNRGAAARATRPINDTSTSTSISTSQSTSNTSNLTKDDPEEDEPTIVVRTKGIGGKKAGNKEKPKTIKKGLSFRDDQEQEVSNPVYVPLQ